MPLIVPNAPKKTELEAIAGLRKIQERTQAVRLQDLSVPVRVFMPHEVFTMTRSDVVKGAGLESARPAGWRYLVAQDDLAASISASLASAIAEVTDQNGVPRFSHRQEGWLAKATQQTIEIAAKIPEVLTGTYELRMLRVPALGRTDAIWLKNKKASDDVVVPIASQFSDVVAGRPYTASEFMVILHTHANMASFDNSPKSAEKEGESSAS